MKTEIEIIGKPASEVVKRMFYLAWQASGVFGMGAFQDRGEQEEEKVWNNIMNAGDYKFGESKPINAPKEGHPYADYVFGRMMKMSLSFKDNVIEFYDGNLRGDYQSWCFKYKSYLELLKAACAELGCEYKQLPSDLQTNK